MSSLRTPEAGTGAALSHAKQALLERWLREGVPRGDRLTIPKRHRAGAEPLSFAQERIWYLDELAAGVPVSNVSGGAVLHGAVDIAALEASFVEVLRRHEVLRSVFSRVGHQLLQTPRRDQTFSISTADLSSLPEPARAAELVRLAREEARAPFDLVAGLPIRSRLIHLAPNEHQLLTSVHHIACDSWSTALLGSELSAAYHAFTLQSQPVLPELPVQYADYAAWQRAELSEETLERDLEYWRARLAGAPSWLDLPPRHPRPRAQQFEGSACSFTISTTLAIALRELSRSEGATLHTALLAAFAVLLQRYSGQDDLIVGTPVLGRNLPELQHLIGCFINSLPLRLQVRRRASFRELLREVRSASQGAFAHQQLPVDRLVQELNPVRDPSRPVLFQAAFDFRREPAPPTSDFVRFPRGPSATAVAGTTVLELNLDIADGPRELAGAMEYSTALFEEDDIVRMTAHYIRILEEAVREPDVPISRLRIVDEGDRRRSISAWGTGEELAAGPLAPVRLEAAARTQPGAIAVIDKEGELTFGQLDSRAHRLANQLRDRGAGPESLIAILLPRSINALVAMLAAWKAGAAFVPLDPSQPESRLRSILDVCRPDIQIDAETLAVWAAELARQPDTSPGLDMHPDQLAYVMYTSGSTGEPKGVMVTHRGLANYLGWAERTYRPTEGSGAPVHTQLTFDLTLTSLLVPLVAGVPVTLLSEVQGPEALVQALQAKGDPYSLVKLTPAHLAAAAGLIRANIARDDARARTRLFVIGGENLTWAALSFWREASPGTRFVNEYGPTETVVGCTAYEAGQPPMGGGSVPIGRP
ncbi:MAG TPA: hypothetical protein DEV93_09970, partial [Chloroflexi bacterium]|nr:hypothetical protein [Chloroflexota bacterium]